MGQWSNLPTDLLMMIHQHLAVRDKIRLNCVCTHWQSTSLDLRQPPPPWLLLLSKRGESCVAYHPSEERVYEFEPPDEGMGEFEFKGSGYGWVVSAHHNGSITVLNPISGASVPLPHRGKFPDELKYRWYTSPRDKIVKIALSCSPDSDGFMAAAIYGGRRGRSRVAHYKAGDEKWRELTGFDYDFEDDAYEDVAFTDGRLYAITRYGHVMVCDNAESCPKLRVLVSSPVYADFSYCDVRLIVGDQKPLRLDRRGFIMRDRDWDRDDRRGSDDKGRFTSRDLSYFKLDMSSLSLVPVESPENFKGTLFTGLGAQLGIVSCDYEGIDGNRFCLISDQFNQLSMKN